MLPGPEVCCPASPCLVVHVTPSLVFHTTPLLLTPPSPVRSPPVLQVSSTYGQYDLCGFPKAAAFWYRTQWLLTVPDGSDKTFATNGKHEVHIVESWESPDSFPSTKGQTTRVVHVYSSASTVELLVNGKSQGVRRVTTMVQG